MVASGSKSTTRDLLQISDKSISDLHSRPCHDFEGAILRVFGKVEVCGFDTAEANIYITAPSF